ncbi:Detected protein of unknown function [Hibiscus syriacus]|uniref:Reverse transcriptase Ty1/copia-type domain-containing protein n=1 Tax=Hibiscus syriacus TaxID=106335 RepID=A0A6A2YS12_HIBSY|nr:Detected protein of unknown function [Hibiscus syriacus]
MVDSNATSAFDLGGKLFTNKRNNIILDEINILMWKKQVLSIVRSHRLEMLLNGELQPPPERVLDVELIDFCLSLWVLKQQLKSGSYLTKIKEVCDALAACGSVVTNLEQIATILNGLSFEYQPFMAMITASKDIFSVDGVKSILVDAETQLSGFQLQSHMLVSANTARVQSGQGHNHNDQYNRNHQYGGQNQLYDGHNQQYGGQSGECGRGRARLQCQLCGKIRHFVDRCWHQFDKVFPGVLANKYEASSANLGVVDESSSYNAVKDEMTEDALLKGREYSGFINLTLDKSMGRVVGILFLCKHVNKLELWNCRIANKGQQQVNTGQNKVPVELPLARGAHRVCMGFNSTPENQVKLSSIEEDVSSLATRNLSLPAEEVSRAQQLMGNVVQEKVSQAQYQSREIGDIVLTDQTHTRDECVSQLPSELDNHGPVSIPVNVQRHKARLVAKGFSQTLGQDFQDTFSPVVKLSTEDIFMEQSYGFEARATDGLLLVCKLRKALYGLRKEPRNWYNKLRDYLVDIGFKSSQADSSLLIKLTENGSKYVLAYIDDIIVIEGLNDDVENVVRLLGEKFSLKDVGVFNYFLGVENGSLKEVNAGISVLKDQISRVGGKEERSEEKVGEVALIALKKVAQLLKYGRKGKPKFCPFRLSNDETTLIWISSSRERSLKLSLVSKIIPGQRTICKEKVEAEVWIAGLKTLISSGQSGRSKIDGWNDGGLYLDDGRDLTSNSASDSSVSATRDISSPEVFVSFNPNTSPKSSQPDNYFHSKRSHAASEGTNMDVKGSGSYAFRVSVSSAPSTSSHGSTPDDYNALGDVYIWGEVIFDSAVKVVADKNANYLSMRADHVALVTRQGEVFTWGEESGGQLGHGVGTDVIQPRIVESLAVTSVDFVACGEFLVLLQWLENFIHGEMELTMLGYLVMVLTSATGYQREFQMQETGKEEDDIDRALLWKKARQMEKRRSTPEAEYRSLADVAYDITWLDALLRDMKVHVRDIPVVWSDNTGVIAVSANLVYHSKTKHVELDVHFVREKVAAEKLKVNYVPSEHQIADGFTKPLTKEYFACFRHKLGVLSLEEVEEGKSRVKDI